MRPLRPTSADGLSHVLSRMNARGEQWFLRHFSVPPSFLFFLPIPPPSPVSLTSAVSQPAQLFGNVQALICGKLVVLA